MPRSILRVVTWSFAFVAVFAVPARADIRCVNPGGTDGCFSSIQAAIVAAGHLDTIQIAAGTYFEKLSMHPPNNKHLTIEGAGAEKTIIDGTGVGNPLAAVVDFQVNPVNGPSVVVSDLTIRGGHRGVNAGRFIRLTLQNVVVRDNGPGSGAGVFNNASHVAIINSTIRNNTANDPFFGCDGSGGTGGGIAALCGGGFYTIVNSAIINNTAREGAAAVFVGGFQTIINSTFSGNVSTTSTGIGGAILNFAERASISHSTFANNSIRAGGGTIAMFSLRNELKANIFQGNTGGNCFTAEPLTSLGYNVLDDGTCTVSGPGDLLNTSAVLGPLQDNGGPTLTHELKLGPGIDLVPASICPAPAADQRGVARAQGDACDAGSVEHVFTVQERLAQLYEVVNAYQPLLTELVTTALRKHTDGADSRACGALAALQDEVNRNSGKHGLKVLTPEQIAEITKALADARAALGCN